MKYGSESKGVIAINGRIKRLRIINLILAIFLIVSIVVQVVDYISEDRVLLGKFYESKLEKVNEVTEINKTVKWNDWAFYNVGQILTEEPQKTYYGSGFPYDITQPVAKAKKGVDINIVPAWEITQGSSDAVVGIVDMGVGFSRYDNASGSPVNLEAMLVRNTGDREDGIDNDGNGYIDDYYGWDFVNDDNTLYDVDDTGVDAAGYHGTYIATTLARMAKYTSIVFAKGIENPRPQYGDDNVTAEAMQYVIDRGANIVICAWTFLNDDPAMYDVMKNNPDVLFVCSSGDYADVFGPVTTYPCSYELDNVLTVMAIDCTGEPRESVAPGDGVPDIAAPGENIRVIAPIEGYVTGTDIATAFVTGAAALLKSQNTDLSPAEIKAALIDNATKTETLEGKCVAGGYLNVYESLMAVK